MKGRVLQGGVLLLFLALQTQNLRHVLVLLCHGESSMIISVWIVIHLKSLKAKDEENYDASSIMTVLIQ